MEYFWVSLAAALAGVGTGLVGLSAATVMVPMLIVLCPSFSGESGAYMATAIALASDVLGSAVTTGVYVKNKNINLRKGWIMLVCIISMCTVGSIAAYLVGNVVLGGFTLFLTFAIGIRFLLKPDTSKDAASENEALNIKGIAISLFFGLTIGFGTGFVGSGGGMMMLVVFTAFLGMERRKAVGTSTFIMTFTALIASTAHILIHPAIVFENWIFLLIGIVGCTLFSLFSAQFANKFPPKTVGLITGAVLTVLGAAMIILNYWDYLCQIPLIMSVFRTTFRFYLYLICCVLIVIPLHFVGLPRDIFRKLLHTVAFCAVVPLVYFSDGCLPSLICLALTVALIFIALSVLEGARGYSDFFVQKKHGEVKISMILLFGMQALVIAMCWGLCKKPYLAVVSVIMWGVGDAMAEIIGCRCGRHKIRWRLADNAKSWEGSLAMAASSFCVGLILLLSLSGQSRYYCTAVAALCAAVGAIVEMLCKNGSDTLFVPISISGTLTLLAYIFAPK